MKLVRRSEEAGEKSAGWQCCFGRSVDHCGSCFCGEGQGKALQVHKTK